MADMDYSTPEIPPPSYNTLDHGAYRHNTASEALFEQYDALFSDQCFPPQAKYFVRSTTDPSSWRLLSGPAMTNATTSTNTDPTKKCRYRVVYPYDYEDVYLHRTPFQSHSCDLPRYHAELYSSKTSSRYEPEPLVILGPEDHDEALTNEAKNIAISLLPKVFSRVEAEIAKTSRFSLFCESEYCSWDWSAKTAGAKADMRALIARAKKECAKCAGLSYKLEPLLVFVKRDKESQDIHLRTIRILQRRISEASNRLERLWM